MASVPPFHGQFFSMVQAAFCLTGSHATSAPRFIAASEARRSSGVFPGTAPSGGARKLTPVFQRPMWRV